MQHVLDYCSALLKKNETMILSWCCVALWVKYILQHIWKLLLTDEEGS